MPLARLGVRPADGPAPGGGLACAPARVPGRGRRRRRLCPHALRGSPAMLIDTDVHNDFGDIADYLPRVWRDRWKRVGSGAGSVHEGNPRGVLRRDAQPPDGGPPASDPVFVLTDHLDRYDIDYAVLTGPGGVPLGPDA